MEDIPAVIGDWKLHRILKSGSYNSLVLSWLNTKTHEKLVTKTWRGERMFANARCLSEINFHQNYKNVNVNIISVKELPKEFEAGLAPINKQQLPVLCMEYCGTSLRQILSDCGNSCGLQECHVRQILQDVNNAVEFLYQNKIPHSNLSPENIVRQYVEPNSNVLFKERLFIYKIIDISMDGSGMDAIDYRSPEFFYDNDIRLQKTSETGVFWSFGLVAFEIICGVKPFLPYMEIGKGIHFTKMKSHDNICAYETFHGDIEFSCEILPETHISKHFKILIEKWLKTALEYQPHVRGRMAPIVTTGTRETYSTQNLTIFTLLKEILDTMEVKIFSVFTLENFSYDFNELTSIGVLKSKIKESTQIHELDQLLISIKTNREVENEELVKSYWENNSSTAFFLLNKKMFFQENIDYIIPKSINRAITTKTLTYNYANSYELYRCGCYFVNSQEELCNTILKVFAVQVEYFHEESKQLLFDHQSLNKVIGNFEAKHEFATYLFETGKNSFPPSYGLNELGSSFVATFKFFSRMFDNISYNWRKFSSAWDTLTVRLQSCSKRSLEFSLQECHLLFQKYDFKDIVIAANHAYDNYSKNIKELVVKDNISVESIKNPCQDALKMKSKLLTELRQQPFILKMLDLDLEISKLKVTLQTASKNSNKLLNDLTEVTQELTSLMWATFCALGSSGYGEVGQCSSFLAFNTSEQRNGSGNSSRALSESDGDSSITDTESLVETSSMLRRTNLQLTAALQTQKNILKALAEDFNFLEDL